MKIESIKLMDSGYQGLVITGKEYFQTENGVAIVDDITRTRKIGLGKETIMTTTKLKYYFLVLTRHWLESYNKFYNRDTHEILPFPEKDPSPVHVYLREIMCATTITGLKLTEKGFIITGSIDSVNTKKININTPLITPDDDAGFFYEAEDHMKKIIIEVVREIKQGQIPKYTKDELIRISKNTVKEGVEGMTEEQMHDKVVEDIQRRGGVILYADDESPDFDYVGQVVIPDKQLSLNMSTKNIDSQNLEDAGAKAEEDTAPEAIDDKDITEAVVTEAEAKEPASSGKQKSKKKSGSTLASEKSFSEATGKPAANTEQADLSNAEFSLEGAVTAENDWGFENAGNENTSHESEMNVGTDFD